eukprot:TRINITY_DN2112_c0_g1_i2.p1 TRINITY_DN2112_c0_g1~~TRINITY_DN2112_c0_g1_i2.p1  ORF type:complete len:343 (-),score=67.77 TRINITY_DN2112_c0_g1_i2:23-1051(-)
MSATVVCLGMPSGAHFGVDLQSWQVGPRFQGITKIPAGVHFLYYGANEMMSSIGRLGFFHTFQEDEVLVRKWSTETETLVIMDPEDSSRVCLAVEQGQFRDKLGPYPTEQLKRWQILSSHITAKCLNRLQPKPSKEIQPLEDEGKSENMADDLANVHYSDIPKRLVRIGESAQSRTIANFDKTAILTQLLEESFGKDCRNLLAELEFAYICFLLSFSFEGFEQWKKMVHLLCGCEQALLQFPDLYISFLELLREHLLQIPKDFLVDTGMWDETFLKASLSSLFSSISEDRLHPQLRLSLVKLQSDVQTHFEYEFEEDGDDAPTIVEESQVYYEHEAESPEMT